MSKSILKKSGLPANKYVNLSQNPICFNIKFRKRKNTAHDIDANMSPYNIFLVTG